MDPVEICEYEHDRLDGCLMTGDMHRKSNKPLMEKRRRARINQSLLELKAVLLESQKSKSNAGHSKWEKADILEMTVQYVQTLRNQQKSTKIDPLATGQYIAGFSECIRQCQKFFINQPADDGQSSTLFEHLLSQLRSFTNDTAQTFSQDSPAPDASLSGSPSSSMTSSPEGEIAEQSEKPRKRKFENLLQTPEKKARLQLNVSGSRSAFVPTAQASSPILASVLSQVSSYANFVRAISLPHQHDGFRLAQQTGAVWRPW